MKTCALLLVVLMLSACGGGSANKPSNAGAPQDVSTAHPPTLEGARAVLAAFLEKDANALKLRSQLKPTAEDLAKIYQPGYVEKAVKAEDRLWTGLAHNPDLKRNADQTRILVYEATTAQLRAWRPPVSEHFADPKPPAITVHFEKVPLYVLDDLTFYRFKFATPDESSAAIFGALLCHVNGRWVLLWNPVYIIEYFDDIMRSK